MKRDLTVDGHRRDHVCQRYSEEQLRSNWEADPGGLHVCTTLVDISPPFNAGQTVEIKLECCACHALHGGEVRLRMSPEDAKLYYLGDEYSMRLRLI